jgi:hypothetical protein
VKRVEIAKKGSFKLDNLKKKFNILHTISAP